MKKCFYTIFLAIILGSATSCGSRNFEPNPYAEAKLDSIDKVWKETFVNDTSKQP